LASDDKDERDNVLAYKQAAVAVEPLSQALHRQHKVEDVYVLDSHDDDHVGDAALPEQRLRKKTRG
jgi:hypothetical protein